MVENGRNCVAHCCRCLNQQEKHDIELDEVREGISQTNREVRHKNEEQRDEEADRNLGNKLGSGVYPNVIHTRVTLTHVNRLLLLEYYHSRLEIECHLRDAHIVDGACHILDAG